MREYIVKIAATQEDAPGTFVLRPLTDPLARETLQFYCEHTQDMSIRMDIEEYLKKLEDMPGYVKWVSSTGLLMEYQVGDQFHRSSDKNVWKVMDKVKATFSNNCMYKLELL